MNLRLDFSNTRASVFFLLSTNDKTDIDIIRNEHRFLWNDEEDAPDETWYRKFSLKFFEI